MKIEIFTSYLFIFHSTFYCGNPNENQSEFIEKIEKFFHDHARYLQGIDLKVDRLTERVNKSFVENQESGGITIENIHNKNIILPSTNTILKRMLNSLRIDTDSLYSLSNNSKKFKKTIVKIQEISDAVLTTNYGNVILLNWFIDEFKIYCKEKYPKTPSLLTQIKNICKETEKNIYKTIEMISSDNFLRSIYPDFKKYSVNSIFNYLEISENKKEEINMTVLERSQALFDVFIRSLVGLDDILCLSSNSSGKSPTQCSSPTLSIPRKNSGSSTSGSYYRPVKSKSVFVNNEKTMFPYNDILNTQQPHSSNDTRYMNRKPSDHENNISGLEKLKCCSCSYDKKSVQKTRKIYKRKTNKRPYSDSLSTKNESQENKISDKSNYRSEILKNLAGFSDEEIVEALKICQNIRRSQNMTGDEDLAIQNPSQELQSGDSNEQESKNKDLDNEKETNSF